MRVEGERASVTRIVEEEVLRNFEEAVSTTFLFIGITVLGYSQVADYNRIITGPAFFRLKMDSEYLQTTTDQSEYDFLFLCAHNGEMCYTSSFRNELMVHERPKGESAIDRTS